jgi:hypothetical protein
MEVPPPRPLRRCSRCGREGRNAFRRIVPGMDVWLCTHEETCVTRMRHRHRNGGGRPAADDDGLLAGFDAGERPICVIGSDPAGVDELAAMLEALSAADVDRLDLSPRSLMRLGRRDWALVVADLRATDPLALVNDLTRRLVPVRRQQVPVVVVRDDGDLRPSLETLLLLAATATIVRPIHPVTLLDALSGRSGAMSGIGA